MEQLQIKLLSNNATLPTRNHATDAGFDIYVSETAILKPQAKELIDTDIAVNIPKGYVGLLTSRSGVSSNTHLVIETGKIDSGFTGHMRINIKNDAQSSNSFVSDYVTGVDNSKLKPFDCQEHELGTYQINKGDKLAQLVIVPIVTPELQQVEEFESESERGEDYVKKVMRH